MSKLSELLNPAPQSDVSPPSIPHLPLPALETTETQLEGDQSIRSTHVFTSNTPRRQSINSPLDALAAAATSSAPLPSPSRTSMSFVDAHPPSLPASSSRPASSHASPPRTFELPPISQRPGQFSPGLEQYHQAHSDEVKARRMSSEMMDDPSRILPPLTQIQPEKEPLAALVNARSHPGGGDPDKESALGQSPLSTGLPIAPDLKSPITTQVRQPSPGPPQRISDVVLPKSLIEQVQVKSEMIDVPPQMTGMAAQGSPQHTGSPASGSRRPSATPVSKSIAGLKKETSTRSSPAPPITESPTPKTSEKPKAAPSKKRVAPKKGTASAVKPPAKKRKIEKIESTPATPVLPRKGSPNSSRASKTPVPKNRKQGSETPARSSSVLNANEDDDQDEGDSMSIDENEQFCICRGPDDHTWMIACDGGCDDWFHGRCVGMDEKDGKLIDKYICPNCIEAGRGQTLWKPMCRLSSCRKPARVDDSKPSKYCSDEHGTEFMRQLAFKGDPPSSPKKPPPTTTIGGRRKSRKDNYTDNIGNAYEEDPGDEGDTFLRGGILRPAELKTLASSTNDITSFRALGEGVLSPPQTDEGDGDIKASSPTATSHNLPTAVHFTPEEKVQLAEIKVKTNGLKERKRMLDDRETFLGMTRSRAKNAVDEMKKKEKGAQICGFDSRLAWADEVFEVWRASDEGKAIFDAGKLGPVSMTKQEADNKETMQAQKGGRRKDDKQVNGITTNNDDDKDDDEEMADADPSIKNGPTEANLGEGAAEDDKTICLKKRCTRHRDWLRVQTNNLALDKDNVREEMRHLMAEDKGIKERAMIRSLEET